MKRGIKFGQAKCGAMLQMIDAARMLGVSERSAYGNYRRQADRVRFGFPPTGPPLSWVRVKYNRAPNTAPRATGRKLSGDSDDSLDGNN
jgi:hypothetical protein